MDENKEKEINDKKDDDIYSGNTENPNFQGKNWVNGEPVKKPKETVIVTIILAILIPIFLVWAFIAFFAKLISLL